jgi:hypothetical protein
VAVDAVVITEGIIPHWLHSAAVPKNIIAINAEMIEYNLIFFITPSLRIVI